MKSIQIKGTIVSDDDQWIYDWFGIAAVSPKCVKNQLKDAENDEITVEVNSGGGDVFAGSEIYYILNQYSNNVTIDIVGFAGSAATIISCAGDKVRMSPTAMYMIHNVSGIASGDYNVMDKNSQILKTANKSICNAYRIKTGMSQEEILNLMNEETWLDPEAAKEKGFIDEIINMEDNPQNKAKAALYNAHFVNVLSEEVKEKIRNTVKKPENEPLKNKNSMAFYNAKLNLLELEGR
ncbi:head maturation protease, ClpP-related [Clostridium sp. BJN0001]|uniref:head maturation protease, ClpP-related n=1 Tax=Clostridium sp. BJN0001 TaxID=2930219 RepID=UPI001FD268BA|nr:head maturation protease, ClpP-related [Clostridium sp. BJN0001]